LANTKITNLASLTAAPGDEIPVNRSGTDGKITVSSIAREKLAADRSYYVNVSTGSDSNTGLSSGAAFATIQKAVDIVQYNLDLNNYNVTINVAAGTYPEEVVIGDYVGGANVDSLESAYDAGDKPYGRPNVQIVGAGATTVLTGGGSPVRFACITYKSQSTWMIDAVKFTPTSTQDGIFVVGPGTNLVLGDLYFGDANSGSAGGTAINVVGSSHNVMYEESTTTTFSGTGWDYWIFVTGWGSRVKTWEHHTVEFSANSAFFAFVEAGEGATIDLYRMTAINLNANTVTGFRWSSYYGGRVFYSLNVGGIQSLNGLPGNSNGVSDGGWLNNSIAPYGLRVGGSSNVIPGTGEVVFLGSSSGAVTVKGAAAAGTWTLTLPANDGDSGQFLTTNGSGTASWSDNVGTIGITIDGGGSAITTGVKGYVTVPYACTITQWYLTGDTSGAIKIDVWREDFAGGVLPDNSDSLTNAHEPEITASGVMASDTDLSDWTSVAIAANDIIGFNVDSCTSITKATLVLKVRK
jgi:hypothetical protein